MQRSPCPSWGSAQSRMELELKDKAAAAAHTPQSWLRDGRGTTQRNKAGPRLTLEGNRLNAKSGAVGAGLLPSQTPALQLSSKKTRTAGVVVRSHSCLFKFEPHATPSKPCLMLQCCVDREAVRGNSQGSYWTDRQVTAGTSVHLTHPTAGTVVSRLSGSLLEVK